MSKKEFEVTCPSCSCRLVVDVLTERVVRDVPAAKPDETGRPKVSEKDWSGAWAKVRDRIDGGEGRLDAALDRERGREAALDELFRRAKDKAESKDAGETDPAGEETGSSKT